MATKTSNANSDLPGRPLRCRAIIIAGAVGLALAHSGASAQNNPVFTSPVTLTATQTRGLADILDRVQRMLGAPITFEEVPYENQAELRTVTVARGGGAHESLTNPSTDLSVTLTERDASPFLAAQEVLSAYEKAGLPGVYTVVPRNDRVDIVPTQVLGANGSMTILTPVMNRTVTFPLGTRTVEETLQMLVGQVSTESARKVVLLSVPAGPFESVELGASGIPARELLANLAVALNRSISFQCLYAAGNGTYYLDVANVGTNPAPSAAPLPLHDYIKPLPAAGPATSPWFKKIEGEHTEALEPCRRPSDRGGPTVSTPLDPWRDEWRR